MRNALLCHAIPLIRTHGFSRQALSLAALSLPNHTEPLSDTAVSALFGPGDEARKALIQAWLEEGINRMGRRDGKEGRENVKKIVSKEDSLKDRLKWNEPVLYHLPEALALLSVPHTTLPLPVLDPLPAVSHPVRVVNKACYLAGDNSIGTTWYAQRTSLALIYTAAELHQLTSPMTAMQFLDTLLESSDRVRDAIVEAGHLANAFWCSWAGIIKSRGLT